MGSMLKGMVGMLRPFADPIFDTIIKYVPGHEVEMLARPDLRKMFVGDLLNGSRQGMQAVVHDVILFARHWGFSLPEIKVPIHFWQGTIDPLVPEAHAHAMAARIPGAGVTVCHNEGHLAGLDYGNDALRFILDHAAR